MIKNNNITLRLLTAEDFNVYKDILSSYSISSKNNVSSFRFKSSNEIKEEIENWNSKTFNSIKNLFAIVENTNNNIIGYFKLNLDLRNKVCSLEYLMRNNENYRLEYSKNSMESILEYIFKILNANKVTIEVIEYNLDLIEALDFFKFKQDARLREKVLLNNRRFSVILYSLLRREYYFNNKTDILELNSIK